MILDRTKLRYLFVFVRVMEIEEDNHRDHSKHQQKDKKQRGFLKPCNGGNSSSTIFLGYSQFDSPILV
jgi:hypothetical protein